jgi:hypothetical protein
MEEKKDYIEFKYIFPDDYNPKYVNGVYGGVNVQGEIIVSFYLERNGLPLSQTHSITKEGTLGPAIERKPEDVKRVRFIQNGIVLNLENAKIIHKWLGEKIEKLEELSEIDMKEEIKTK